MTIGIVLAAGAATRMGKPKQLLPFGRTTLLEHVAEQALAAGFDQVLVVTGASAGEVRESLSHLKVSFVHNQNWELGMGSSIVAGLSHLLDSGANVTAVAILLGDQPLVRSDQLASMRALLEKSDAPVVAARYGATLGAPAFFKRDMFAALVTLPASSGARHIVNVPGFQVVPFDLPEAAVDIDTPEDFQNLKATAS